MIEKTQHFLLLVQTAYLSNAINTAVNDEKKEKRDKYSASGAFIVMDEAVDALSRIPSDMSARDAANDFIAFMITEEKKDNPPKWILR